MFVKDQNKIQPVQLVPWKSTNQKDNKDDQNVPLRATVISTMSLIVASIVLPIRIILDINFWLVSIFVVLLGSMHLPLLLLFIIKRKKKNKTPVQSNQPVKKLHFHDDAIGKSIFVFKFYPKDNNF